MTMPRSYWEQRFGFWKDPASATEEEEIQALGRRIRGALDRSNYLNLRPFSVIPQGSYHNRTNVRRDSDMDLCVCLGDRFLTGGAAPTNSALGRFDLPLNEFDVFRSAVASSMNAHFGLGNVFVGSKAIQIHKDDGDRVNADVVPAFTHELYDLGLPPGRSYRGVAIRTTSGQWITNFPEQHYENAVAKNDRTRRHFKRVVRIFKRLRNQMASDEGDRRYRVIAEGAPSFGIESAIYNVPDSYFGSDDYTLDVTASLDFLTHFLAQPAQGLLQIPAWASWYEVNGIKLLFRSDQPWTAGDALSFFLAVRAYTGL